MSATHIVIVEKRTDFRWPDPDSNVITAEEFVSEHSDARSRPRKVINLCRSYDYLSMGYYCSLLAEARGDRVTPSVETIVELRARSAESTRLAGLTHLVGRLNEVPRSVNLLSFHVFFGQVEDPHLSELARRSFELFRCPLLAISLERVEGVNGWRIARLNPLDLREVDPARDKVFQQALEQYMHRSWRTAVVHSLTRMDLAVLYDPKEPLPPSRPETLQTLVRVGRSMNIDVVLIVKKDFSRLTQFDALFIRETTAVDNHTFKFAKKAASEGMPVIDDPVSILRCTNKAYLAERLRFGGIATPRTRLLSRRALPRLEDILTYPIVLKVPDGSFSRNVKKAENWKQFQDIAQSMFIHSDIILAQEFMYTEFDWRVGVLAGEPLFVARYFMTHGNWQILKHTPDGKHAEGRTEAISIKDTPRKVLDAALHAAQLVGDGLYGVDLKEHATGVYVIEINDNPNIDIGMEDAVLGDELYRRLLGHLLSKFESSHGTHPNARMT